MDNEVLDIFKDDIEIAQKLCNSITENDVRNRAAANVLAAKLATRYLSEKGYDVDTSSGLHNCPNVLEHLDIADIYVKGAYIDVRLYFSEEELSIPKLHFDLDMTPVAYMFIKLEQDLSGYKVAGFIRPDFVNKDNFKDDYYYLKEDDLISLYDVESHLTPVYDSFNGSKEMLYSFVDGSIDESNIIKLMKVLIESANARITLIKAFKANSVFKFVSTQNIAAPAAEQQAAGEISEETASADSDLSENDLEEIFNSSGTEDSSEDDLLNALDYSTEITPSNMDLEDSDSEPTENDEQIDSLFTGEQEGVPVSKKNKSSSGLIVFLLIVLLIGGGIFAYTKFAQPKSNDTFSYETLPDVNNEAQLPENTEKAKEEAMPIETVNETNNIPAPTEEAAPIAIPAIEQHLDASVLVANLKVDWEVPAGFASNTTAKGYLVKLGKIIQLNLKSDLLLLSKPPISNKITVELTFNPSSGRFEVVGIKDSSGEQSVDKVILDTIRSALSSTTTSNAEYFGKLQGNPVLIIHL